MAMDRLRQSCCFMRTTALVVLVCFTSLILFQPVAFATESLVDVALVDTLAAPTGVSKSGRLDAALNDVDTVLAELQPSADLGSIPTETRDKLNKLLESIDISDNDILERFSGVESHLGSIAASAVIMQRQQNAVAAYRQDMVILRSNLQAIVGADTPAALQQTVTAARKHLAAKRQKRSHEPLDPQQLPFHVPAAGVRKPKTAATGLSALIPPRLIKLASHTLTSAMLIPPVAPQPEDLQASDEVQLTPAIRALAAELGNNPVSIFNWVSNELAFVPTYGAIQGSQMALETRKANAFDTASLLLALLRAADIPARYVYGTVELPVEQMMNWVGGAGTPEAALKLLAQGGIPSEGLVQGGRITHIRMEHVWVEAWVDYYPSRGAVNRQGDSWVAMDGSFKQYQYTSGLDVSQAAGFDAEAFVQQLSQSVQVDDIEGWVSGVDAALIETTLDDYRQQIEDQIARDNPDVTVADILGGKTIIPQQRDILPTALPYHVVARAESFARLSASMRHDFRYAIYATALDRTLDNPAFVFERSLPILAGSKLTLGFVPETADDAALIESYLPQPHADGTPILDEEWPAELPGYLIKLTAEFRVDGVVVQRGGSFTLGDEFYSRMALHSPGEGWQGVSNSAIAGSTMAIDVAGVSASATQMQALSHRTQATSQALLQGAGEVKTEHFIGDMLYGTVLAYFSMLNMFRDIAASAQGVISYPLPSLGSFQTDMNVTHVFGVPMAVSEGGLLMDIDRSAAVVVDKNGDNSRQAGFNAMMGMFSSLLENVVPEQMLSTDEQPVEGVSAAKALMLANQQGQKIYRVTSDNSASVLPALMADTGVKTDISNAIAAGMQATVHESPITLGQWSGTGYIITDPETGSGAYRISGGANGGWADVGGMITPVLTFWETWDVAAMGNKFSKFSNSLGAIGAILGAMTFAVETWEECKDVGAKILVLGLMAGFIAIIGSTLTALALSPLASILFSVVANFIADNFMRGIRSIAC